MDIILNRKDLMSTCVDKNPEEVTLWDFKYVTRQLINTAHNIDYIDNKTLVHLKESKSTFDIITYLTYDQRNNKNND